jgi:hypothetical protein
MNRQKSDFFCIHGPDNAEYEIRKAYNAVIETCVSFLWKKRQVSGIQAQEMIHFYHRAFQCYQSGNRLGAERWARAAKHLSRAFQHEAKISYLHETQEDLPYLKGPQDEDYHFDERSDTTLDLINSVANTTPVGFNKTPTEMLKYLSQAKKHLEPHPLNEQGHELLQIERIQAAHEYGRALECMALAYEAELRKKNSAA